MLYSHQHLVRISPSHSPFIKVAGNGLERTDLCSRFLMVQKHQRNESNMFPAGTVPSNRGVHPHSSRQAPAISSYTIRTSYVGSTSALVFRFQNCFNQPILEFDQSDLLGKAMQRRFDSRDRSKHMKHGPKRFKHRV